MGLHDDIPHHDEIPDMPNEPHEWLDEALARIAMETECCQEHFSKGELGQIVMHLSSLVEGTKLTYMHAFEMLDDETRMAVVKALLEIETGIPVENITRIHVGEHGDGYLIKLDNTPIPDDLSGLDDGNK